MKLRIISTFTPIATALRDRLEQTGLNSVTCIDEATERFELRLTSSVASAALDPLLQALAPFQPPLIPGVLLEDADAELHLGDSKDLMVWNLILHTDSPALTTRLREPLVVLGFDADPERNRYGLLKYNRMIYGGATRFARQMLQWCLMEMGFPALTEQKEWGDKDPDLLVQLRDPALADTALAERFGVQIGTDDLTATHELVTPLREAGFRDIEIARLEPAEANDAQFKIIQGPFAKTPEAIHLQTLVQQLMDRYGIARDRYPIVVNDDDATHQSRLVLVLPLAAALSGARPPYAGSWPERFVVTLRADRPHPAIEQLSTQLREQGFTRLNTIYRSESSDSEDADEISGFRIIWNAAHAYPEITDRIKPLVLTAMDGLDARPRFSLQESKDDEDKAEIIIGLPVDGVADGTLFTRLCRPGRFQFKLHTPDPAGLEPLLTEFRNWGFAKCAIERDMDIDQPALHYGGASLELIEQVRTKVRELTGLDPVSHKQWGDSDRDVWLYLPTCDLIAQATTPEPALVLLDEWLVGPEAAIPSPFLAVADHTLRVGDITLLRRAGPRHPLAPPPEAFAHYCLDPATAETLVHLAAGVALAEPCLLEGETSTSKTSSILYLAALLNQPVVRINLNGQTDTGELVGRYVPQDLTVSLPFPTEELRTIEDLLEPETRLILQRAEHENRVLSRVEVVQIMANERMRSHPWRWQDGPIVEALRQGWWVILDEVNLAEPQILERLNSVLERDPALVLTEYDHRVLGPGGEPIHGDFRIFATMNPAEYAGRSLLSPAYRNRWRAYRQMPRPGEAEYRAMLRFVVFGEQPEVTVMGQRYQAAPAAPPHPALAALVGIDELFDPLVRFQVGLEQASGQPPGSIAHLGARRRERYVFTRRDLLSILDYLASPLAASARRADHRVLRKAIYRYYLSRVTAGEDRQLVLQLLDAAGLGPGATTAQ